MAPTVAPNGQDYPQTSVYSEILCVWRRIHDGVQIAFLQAGVDESITSYCDKHSADVVHYPDRGLIRSTIETNDELDLLEYETLDGQIGCYLSARKDQKHLDFFRCHAVSLILTAYSEFKKPEVRCLSLQNHATVQQILLEFEQDLLFDSCQPQFAEWYKSGRQMFFEKLCGFVYEGKAIEMALPAFPCKTSNLEKAATKGPDGAELLALNHLYSWCMKVYKIYKPGCYINIISDGHVFSDCIGVDDNVVDSYNTKLQAMLRAIENKHLGSNGGIRFYNLGDLLSGAHLETAKKLDDPWKVHIPPNTVNHPVRTKINCTNETQRALLMLLASPPAVYLQDVVKAHPEHPLTKLFRGFSRFMFEDLAHHDDYKNVSAKQRQKAAEKVAVEMILRNQSYSRLVEMVMPGHIRLSIHGHNNAGPKFAVRTMPKHVRYAATTEELVNALKADSTQEEDAARETLHIPTPWHNAIVQAGTKVFICKAKLASEEALRDHAVVGNYDRNKDSGCYVLSFQEEINS